MFPFICEVYSLWVGLDQWPVKFSRLGKILSVFWWVGLNLFFLECNEVSNSQFGVSMGLAWLWAACLLMFYVVLLFCWRISMVCLALKLDSSMEVGFSVGLESFG